VDRYTGPVYVEGMDLDLDDDRLTLLGPPRPPPPPTEIGYVVYLHRGARVSPPLPVFHREGEPEKFDVTWHPKEAVTIDEVECFVLGREEMGPTWSAEMPKVLLAGDSLQLSLVLHGLRNLFDQPR